MSARRKLKQGIQVIVGGYALFSAHAIYSGNERFWREMVMPTLKFLDPETAHGLSIKAAKMGIIPRRNYQDTPSLSSKLWDMEFSNPVGLAAGFDKQGEAVNGLVKMGFGFVEVGSVTPKPQPGNPKPRVFRLGEDEGVINRYGFNSDGHEVVYDRLNGRDSSSGKGILGVNLGKNKESPDAVDDYVIGVKKFGELADYLVINVSSPNTPGLRKMQGKQQLKELIDKVLEARDNLPVQRKPPVLVKIAPDLSDEDKKDIADVLGRKKGGVDGMIISNTTISRPMTLKSESKSETGGLSGVPLKSLSTRTISDMYKLTGGRIPIVGVGGISCGEDAYEKIKAGASLVQLYSALTYQGPPVVGRIKRELDKLLKKDGYESVTDAVGADHKKVK